jgi:hypothetical protein
VHLVQELLLHGVHAHPAARARRLGDDRRAVLEHLGHRVAQAVHVRQVPPVAAEVAARHLTRALEQVAHQHGRRHPVPIVPRPPHLVHDGAGELGGVGGAARDHDLRPRLQGLGDGAGAEVDVGEQQAVCDLLQRPAVVHVPELRPGGAQLGQTGADVVAPHHGHAQADAQLPRHPRHLAPRPVGVDAAGVGHQADAAAVGDGQELPHEGADVLRVPGPRVALAVLLQDRHGELGQMVEGDVAHVAPRRDVERGPDAAAVEPQAAADADAPHAAPPLPPRRLRRA